MQVTSPAGTADMAFVDVCSSVEEASSAQKVVLLHGNPTSSYLWRDVIPAVLHAQPKVRCVAPDLIGMGASGSHPDPTSPTAFTFRDHAAFVDVFMDAIVGDGEKVVLVLHDWGSALGFHWAARHPERVSGIVHMESVVAPVSFDTFPEGGRKIFQLMRTPDVGEDIVLNVGVPFHVWVNVVSGLTTLTSDLPAWLFG